MNTKKKLTGLVIASAAAIAFSAIPMASALAGSQSSSANAKVKCMGVNQCKGHSACGAATSKCSGLNSCKGKGFIKVKTKAQCKVLQKKMKQAKKLKKKS